MPTKIEVTNLLSPKEAATRLKITTMTLWRWTQTKKVTPIVLAGTNYYPVSEVERIEEERRKKIG